MLNRSIIWKAVANDIFLLYSWCSTVFFLLMDVTPPFLRFVVFKVLLGKMGKKVMIDYKVYMRYLKNIELGDRVVINKGCQFYTSQSLGKKIKIGNNVTISPNTKFYGAAQDYKSKGFDDIADEIIIEDDCWICADCTILQGVRIGRGSVIGAASVVNKDVPSNSVALGNPAIVIKRRNTIE